MITHIPVIHTPFVSRTRSVASSHPSPPMDVFIRFGCANQGIFSLELAEIELRNAVQRGDIHRATRAYDAVMEIEPAEKFYTSALTPKVLHQLYQYSADLIAAEDERVPRAEMVDIYQEMLALLKHRKKEEHVKTSGDDLQVEFNGVYTQLTTRLHFAVDEGDLPLAKIILVILKKMEETIIAPRPTGRPGSGATARHGLDGLQPNRER